MSSKPGKLIFFVVLILLAAAGRGLAQTPVQTDRVTSHEGLFEGFVYFADPQKTVLKSIKKNFSSALNSNELGQEIIKALIAGPARHDFEPTWPGDTRLNSFFITEDGTAYADLNLKQKRIETMDTRSELLAIYSMVNSLTLNIPGIKRVKLLIQGRDALTLAGHIDLEYFYKTNMLIVK